MPGSKTKPSVLHVITAVARGGAENHLFDLVQGQVDAGWNVAVAFLKSDGDRYWQQPFEKLGVKTKDLCLSRYGQVSPMFRLRRFIDHESPSLVHAHLPPAELYTRVALMGRPDVPLVISKHNDKAFMSLPFATVVERWCASRASRVIAISGAVSRYFAERWSKPLSDRLVTIHYGLDPAPYGPQSEEAAGRLREEWGVAPDDFLVGTVARLTAQKALDVMLRGFAGAVAREPASFAKLVIVGRGELERKLKTLCSELGLSDRVLFAGFRTDIPAVMRSFDLFALTSDFEGFGLVLLEAQAAERPVLATAVSAIPEVVSDGVTGVLVPRQDHQAFADALLRFCDPKMRQKFGSAGAQRVRDSFPPSAMIRRTLDVYSTLNKSSGQAANGSAETV